MEEATDTFRQKRQEKIHHQRKIISLYKRRERDAGESGSTGFPIACVVHGLPK